MKTPTRPEPNQPTLWELGYFLGKECMKDGSNLYFVTNKDGNTRYSSPLSIQEVGIWIEGYKTGPCSS